MGYHVPALRNFFRTLDGEDEFIVSAESGRNAVELIEAASRSSLEGRWIDLPVGRKEHGDEIELRRSAIYRPAGG